ncbi:MAG: rhodanese-like domain-containing protein [Proteobacteria bacterium]|nr:rhodanese-like domain-containing protein [Pseudomonadota bacterium]
MIKIITSEELFKEIQKDNVLLIDVRELDEFDEDHIKSAFHMPLSALDVHLIPKTDKMMVFYCRSGVRSANACGMASPFFEGRDLYNLKGGILEWRSLGY